MASMSRSISNSRVEGRTVSIKRDARLVVPLLCLVMIFTTPPGATALESRATTTPSVPITTGDPVVAIASVMGGVEWAIDMPWRMEPPYDRLPINIAFHDIADPKDGSSVPAYQRFCDLVVVIARPPASPGLLPTILSSTRIGGQSLHEVERSAKWPASSDVPAFHTLRRHWKGETITTTDLRLADTAEWHGTALLDIGSLGAGDYLITAAAIVSPNANFCPAWQSRVEDLNLVFGAQGRFVDPTTAIWHANTFRVHLAQLPLPRFGDGWVYGDLHYHSQGTDNEGESAYSYRSVLQAMKAMGLDFAVAADHTSSSDQVTDIDAIFVDNLPDIPYLPDFLEGMILDAVSGVSFPVETAIDAARDMNPHRWHYLHGWINGPQGANRQVRSSGGSLRAPQLILGGEVDVIPEISPEDRAAGVFTYGNNRQYGWAAACTQVPSVFLDLINYTTFEICGGNPTVLTEEASEGGRYLLRDIQGLAQPTFFARQHLIHLPSDPTRDDAFVAGETTRYGGAHRRLKDVLTEDFDALGKGYFFLAHPVAAASGNGLSRLGPDLVPYSEVQLTTAFRSPHFLGLQLWNEDNRLRTEAGSVAENGDLQTCPADNNFGMRATGFPMSALQDCDGDFHDPNFEFPEMRARFSHWGGKDEGNQLSSLHHGAAMWDKLLLWGMNPAKTAGLTWLPADTPRRVFMAGGSDAHGDLNYRREGAVTGWSSTSDTAIGKPRNLMFVGAGLPQPVEGGTTISQTQVVDGFRSGQFSVTDGPALRIAIDRTDATTTPAGPLPKGVSAPTGKPAVVGVIDDGDVQMGGFKQLPRSTLSLLVEWKSTPEFGPVTSIDIYVGAQAGTLDGVVWAPAGHGTHGPSDASGTTGDAYPAADGRVFTRLHDGYMLDPTGTLRITVPAAQGMGGVRTIPLNCANFPVVGGECHTETETIPPVCQQLPGVPGGPTPPGGGPVTCTKPVIIERTVCNATGVTAAERLYVRAFARTSSTAPVVTGTATVERFAYTNPIWIRPTILNVTGTDVTATATTR